MKLLHLPLVLRRSFIIYYRYLLKTILNKKFVFQSSTTTSTTLIPISMWF